MNIKLLGVGIKDTGRKSILIFFLVFLMQSFSNASVHVDLCCRNNCSPVLHFCPVNRGLLQVSIEGTRRRSIGFSFSVFITDF